MVAFITNNKIFSLRMIFHNIALHNLYHKHCPIINKILSFKRFCNPWLDSRIIQLINRRHIPLRLYKMGVVSLNEVNEFQSYVGGQICSAKRKYFKDKLDMCSSNSRKILKIYNNILGREGSLRILLIKWMALIVLTRQLSVTNSTIISSLLLTILMIVSLPLKNLPSEYMSDRLPHSFFCLSANSVEIYGNYKLDYF